MTDETQPSPAPRRRPQISLSTILLVIAACAVWLAYRNARQETLVLQAQLPGLRSAARELNVTDSDRYAIVFRRPTVHDESIWDLHVPIDPDGRSYRLHVALDEIPAKGLCQPLASAPIQPGKRVVELGFEYSNQVGKTLVLVDGVRVIEAPRTNFKSYSGSRGGSQFNDSVAADPAEPLVMFRRRFMYRDKNRQLQVPDEPSPGVLLWIEREDDQQE